MKTDVYFTDTFGCYDKYLRCYLSELEAKWISEFESKDLIQYYALRFYRENDKVDKKIQCHSYVLVCKLHS